MTESNNVVSLTDWKNKKDPEQKKQVEKAREDVSTIKIDKLEEQPQPLYSKKEIAENNYTKFVTDSSNASKIQFVIDESIKAITLQYPEIKACRIGDVLLLKEVAVSLIMRSALNQDHPFQVMADKLEITFNRGMNDGITK